MIRWTGVALLGGPLILLLVMGLSAGSEPRADLVVASDELRSVDPHKVSWMDEIRIAGALFEGLTRLNSETFLPEPACAATWSVSDDQIGFTFTLRPGLRWSNGDPLTAEDFRWSWLRVLDPRTQSQYANLMFVIAGAEAYYRSRLDADPGNDLPPESVGVAAPDAVTLRLRLHAPCSYLLDLTSFPTFSPVHRATIEKYAGLAHRASSGDHVWTRPGRMVCNGAFVLAGWEFKSRLLLERNERFWDAASIAARRIELLISSDASASLLGYETGRVDLLFELDQEIARVLQAAVQRGERDDFHLGDRFSTFFFRVSCRRPPLDDARVRRALSLAIDREALCEHVLGLGETPAETYVPRGALREMPRRAPDGRTVYYEPPAGAGAGWTQAERVAEARRLLDEAGYADRSRLRTIEVAFAPEPRVQRRLVEAVQAMWERSLGIRVDLRTWDRKVIATKIRELDYDVARSDWYGDYMDPSTFLDMFTTVSGQNRTGWSHAEYDRLIAAAAVEPDNARRFEHFQAAERILCEQELPIIPLYFKRGNFLLRPGVGGLNANVRGILPLHRARPLPLRDGPGSSPAAAERDPREASGNGPL